MATQLRDPDVDLITRGHLEKGAREPANEFAGTFSAETVERFMAESLEGLGGARLKNFVPLFVHRFARERLRALGQAQGSISTDGSRGAVRLRAQRRAQPWPPRCPTTTPKAACACTRRAAPPRRRSTPTSSRLMAELGIDLSKPIPKPMTDEVVQPPTS